MLTARVLIRLAHKLDLEGGSDGSPSSLSDEEYYTPLEDEDLPVTEKKDPVPKAELAPDGVSARSSSSSSKRPEPSKFSHAGQFDLLGDLPEEEAEKANIPAATMGRPSGLMMPPWNSQFWKLYGNKLRVNGTKEGVCNLSDS